MKRIYSHAQHCTDGFFVVHRALPDDVADMPFAVRAVVEYDDETTRELHYFDGHLAMVVSAHDGEMSELDIQWLLLLGDE